MSKKNYILVIIIISFLITLSFGMFKKTYFTYKYEISFPIELKMFISVNDFIAPVIEKKDHFIGNIISRNTREGKIEILKSFKENDKVIVANYLNKLEFDLIQTDLFIKNFLSKLNEKSKNNLRIIDENSKLLRLENLLNNNSFLNIKKKSITKTHKFYSLNSKQTSYETSKINYNITIFYLLSIFILVNLILLIIFNAKKIVELIKKL